MRYRCRLRINSWYSCFHIYMKQPFCLHLLKHNWKMTDVKSHFFCSAWLQNSYLFNHRREIIWFKISTTIYTTYMIGHTSMWRNTKCAENGHLAQWQFIFLWFTYRLPLGFSVNVLGSHPEKKIIQFSDVHRFLADLLLLLFSPCRRQDLCIHLHKNNNHNLPKFFSDIDTICFSFRIRPLGFTTNFKFMTTVIN